MRRLIRRIEETERQLGRDRVRLRGERVRLQRIAEAWMTSPAGLGLGFGAGLAAGLRRPGLRGSDVPSLARTLMPFLRSFLEGLEQGRQPADDAGGGPANVADAAGDSGTGQ